jgi:hypothetical protein
VLKDFSPRLLKSDENRPSDPATRHSVLGTQYRVI